MQRDAGVYISMPISVKLVRPTASPLEKSEKVAPVPAQLIHPAEEAKEQIVADENPAPTQQAVAVHEETPDAKLRQEVPPDEAQARRNRGVMALSRMWGRTAMMNARMRQMQLYIDALRANLSGQLTMNIAAQQRERLGGEKCSVILQSDAQPLVECNNIAFTAQFQQAIDWSLLPNAGGYGFSRLEMEVIVIFSATEIGIGFKPGAAMNLPPELAPQ